LPKTNPTSFIRRARRSFLALSLSLLTLPAITAAQAAPAETPFTRLNTFAFFGAYSNDSSHILLGIAEKRKLLDFGAGYGRRLLLNNTLSLHYSAEFLPVALESDPLGQLVTKQTAPTAQTFIEKIGPLVTCAPETNRYDITLSNGITYIGTQTLYCHGRQWTIGEALSPLGFQLNFRPRHALQPFLVSHVGNMYTTKPIPVSNAGSFNFTLDAGAGVELYRGKSRSLRAEYRFHHISNAGTGQSNPGIDNGLLQITYAFGR
jgi:hypothetical protein